MNRYLRLFRFENTVMGVVGILVGALLAAGFDILESWIWIVVACVLVIMFMAGGNALNDYIDREIDKTAHPDRPVPSGEISPSAAKNLGLVLLLIAVLISVPLGLTGVGGGWISSVMVLICAALMLAYETALKQRGLVGNLTIAFLTAMIFMVGGSVTGHPWDNAVFAGMAFLVNAGREISKDIEDMDSDEGRKTLPMSIGKKRASVIASVFFVLGPVLSIYPVTVGDATWAYYIVTVADVMFLYSAYIAPKDAHRAQKTAKYAMAVALIAFILDVIA